MVRGYCRAEVTQEAIQQGADAPDDWVKGITLVGYGVDTLVLNVRYTDTNFSPIKQALDESLVQVLDALQGEARTREEAVASPWFFEGVVFLVEPLGAGKQWRWRLTSRLLTLVISRGTFTTLIAQVRFSSEYLWTEAWAGDALSKVHTLLMSLFGQYIGLQVSEVHLCADVVGYDFSLVNYASHFVSRMRKQESHYSLGVDGVTLDHREVSTLRFSSHGSPISCTIYNKTLEIRQKSGKTWFYDLWEKQGWDKHTAVWRVEFRYKRAFLHNLKEPIEEAYGVLDQFKHLWEYAAGHVEGGEDGWPDGWLRYVVPTQDETCSRWPTHPVWRVVQSAFAEDCESGLGPLVRQRIREKNLERGVAAMIGYSSTLAAWLGGEYASQETDASLTLQWLYEAGNRYLTSKQRDFLTEVRKKQERYGMGEMDEPAEELPV